MRSIVIILPYFGKFRKDFPLWLRSVEYNPSIDFIIFTDQEIKNVPRNVKVHKLDLQNMEQLARKYVYERAVIRKPYKLCDYKPTYGDMFQDYIRDYDFWGHCDCDLIFGDIRKFLTDELLDNHERILTRGHLTIYKNVPQVNSHYKHVKNPRYEDVYTTDKDYGFDEWRGTSLWWLENKKEQLYDEIVFDDITPHVYPFYSYQKRHDDVGKKNVMFTFDRGKLYRYYEQNDSVCREETLYVHFQRRTISIKTSLTYQFSIVPNKVIEYVENVTLGYLRNKVHTGKIWVYKERLLAKLNKIIGGRNKRYYLTLLKPEM